MKLRFLASPITRETIFVLSIFGFLMPGPYLPVPELDATWQVVLEAAFFKGWEFGRTVNFTGGPLSFLYTPTSMGYHVWGQIFVESIILIFALLIIFRSLRGQPILISSLVAGSLIISSAVGKDGLYFFSIAAGSFTIIRDDKPKYSVFLIPAYIAVLGLMKFSFAVLGVFCLGTLAVGLALKKTPGASATLLASYLATFFIIWILIGQNLTTIPAYFINSLSISQGYLWNMNLHEEAKTFYCLVAFLIITSLPIFLVCFVRKKELNSWLILLVCAATIFLSWKAGLTRADSHISIFIQASFATSFLVVPLIPKRIQSIGWVVILFVSYLIIYAWAYPGGIRPIVSLTGRFLQTNLRLIANPGSLYENYTKLIPVVKTQNTLHEVKSRVGQSSIDVLHNQQAILFLNDLNYHPRPTIQHYHGFNNHLLNLNLQHIQTDPPDFLLSKVKLVDQRYPFSDDSLYNYEVFQNYHPLLTEKDYLLLERSKQPSPITTAAIVIEDTIKSGADVDVSVYSNALLWLAVDYTPSLLHRFFAFLYKPEILWINIVLEDGSKKSFRLPGGVLEQGFLLNPLLESNEALENFLTTQEPLSTITSFNIVSDPGKVPFPTEKFSIRISVLNRTDQERQ